MTRFNTPAAGTKTTNLAGGNAYTQKAELELVSLMLTSFANDQFYRSADATFIRMAELIALCPPLFSAKAAVYARREFGMRSISHVAASEIAQYAAGHEWAQQFYDQIIYRVDDMAEILAYHQSKKRKVTNAMKKGFAKAFNRFNAYHLAKYRGETKAWKLVDVVNLVHPVATESNRDALKALMTGKLTSEDTWEAMLTRAGQNASGEEHKAVLKAQAWLVLIHERKIGYFALLRNLRNILEQAPDALPGALDMLTDVELIRKSLVLPFRYTTAYAEVQKLTGNTGVRATLIAIAKATDIAVGNIPVLPGETLVVLDVSASMDGRPAEIGALFAATLVKSCNADFMTFSNDAQYQALNPLDSVVSISQSIRFQGGGTNFGAIFDTASRAYDRVIILSDMQGWMDRSFYGHKPQDLRSSFANWRIRTGADPVVYSFDLQGYGTLQMPERNVYCLAGFSEKIFTLMGMLETDKDALINRVKEVEL